MQTAPCRLISAAAFRCVMHCDVAGIWRLLLKSTSDRGPLCLQSAILVLDFSFKADMYAEHSSSKAPDIHQALCSPDAP